MHVTYRNSEVASRSETVHSSATGVIMAFAQQLNQCQDRCGVTTDCRAISNRVTGPNPVSHPFIYENDDFA